MANRAQVSKAVAYMATGAANAAKVSKCVAYLLLEPSSGPDTSNRQGHVYSQIIRRD